MNVVLIGSGGREHAIAGKLFQSEKVDNIYIIPGNAGTAEIGINISLDTDDHNNIIEFCKNHEVNFVIIGPEAPLASGLSDNLRKTGIKVFGPSQKAAQIESDKSFAKDLMNEYNIPTAEYKTFSSKDYDNTLIYLKSISYPVVIKASGLAAGKGVSICNDFNEAKIAVDNCFVNSKYGQSGNTIVIEEFLEGDEFSIFAITDGKDYVLLPAAQDHKRIGEGDTGENTGGMGAYAPVPFVTHELLTEVENQIIKSTLKALTDKGSPYSGCLYAGLILTDEGPKVIEFNCRFGDPETQVVLPLIDGDFFNLLYSTAEGKVDIDAVKYNGGSALGVVLVSGGYPGKYKKGFEINGLDKIKHPSIQIIHAGTKEENGKILTNGGRVLNIIGLNKENNITACNKTAYEAIHKVNYQDIHFRKDIGYRALNS
ncbi:phosphoribosylamine--glycine ligase [bacterium BMS3Abin04]|nr:phosphoribosylamine--glycine ligase [bacterium BMS3Abin04]